jgi:protein TonB
MFNNLVESHSHKEVYMRRGSIFLATMAVYALLLLAAGVFSVYAYDAQLETQSTELALVTFVPVDSTTKPLPTVRRENRPRATTSADNGLKMSVRPVLQSSTEDPLKVPDKPGTAANNILPAPPNAIVGPVVSDPSGSGPIGPRDNSSTASASAGNSSGTNPINEDLPEPPVIKKPKISPPVSLGAINGRALTKPAPPYPPLARKSRISGTVTVQILLDESGRVISAHATSGHPLLQTAAVQAAYQARFSPTLLSGQPVKASGWITYNFVLQ